MSLHKAPVSLTGEVFVFTGKLTYFTRKEARNIVRSLGATCSDNVTKQTTYLVTGLKDLDNYINGTNSTKVEKARYYIKRGYDIKIINDLQFNNLIKLNKKTRE